jgi:predicted Zn-ribbon and HTH transcriptional regulator
MMQGSINELLKPVNVEETTELETEQTETNETITQLERVNKAMQDAQNSLLVEQERIRSSLEIIKNQSPDKVGGIYG